MVYPNLSEFLCKLYNKSEVYFCTEYVRAGIKYCCHPNFAKRGPFYDWLLILFSRNQVYPCKLIAVVPGDKNNFDGYDLIVQCTTRRVGGNSVLFINYDFSQNLYKIDANAVYGPCFVIEADPGKSIISLAKDIEDWPKEFTACYNKNA